MVNRKYDMMEKVILDACQATLIKQNVELSESNYKIIVNAALNAIIEIGQYNYFTNSMGARDRVRQFAPEDYFNLIADRVSSKFGKDIGEFLYTKDLNGNDVLSKKGVEACINYYAMNVIPDLLSSRYFSVLNDMDNDYINNLESKIENIHYYAPSNNKCREAVMTGKQTACMFSEAKCAGMQSFSSVGIIRENQEDSYYIGVHPKNSNFKIMLVADGMGGHNNGEIASNIAAKELLQWFERIPSDEYYAEDNSNLDKEVSEVVGSINDKIKRNCSGGGTTLCMAIIREGSIYTVNIGDSKGFILEDGNVIYTTVSDNIPSKLGVPESFNRFHPDSNKVLRALGYLNENMGIRSNVIHMREGKTYNVVLCSDGVSDCLANDQITDIINHSNKEEVAYNLVNSALNHRSSFQEELKRSKVKAGITGRFSYHKLIKLLDSLGMGPNYESIINPGKDNTTAVSGEFRKGSR